MTLTSREEQFTLVLLKRDYDDLYRRYKEVRASSSRAPSRHRMLTFLVHAMQVNRRVQEKIVGHPVLDGRPDGPWVPRLASLRDPEEVWSDVRSDSAPPAGRGAAGIFGHADDGSYWEGECPCGET